MKLMVSVLLLVAICHAAEVSRSRQEEEEKSAKRELQEGSYGQRIQPSSIFENAPKINFRSTYNGNDIQDQGRPQTEYGPPRLPIAKISDVLSGQGASFPAAIQSHLYSPVQVYQPRLGSPTSFEVSPPVPSQLAYSEHKIYMAPPDVQNVNNLQVSSQNLPRPQSPPQLQQPPIQFNPFSAFSQLQPPRQPQQILSNEFLPRLDSSRFLARPNFPQQIYQRVFSEQSGVIPQDIYQQINHLGNQLPYEETVQISQYGNNEARGYINRDDFNQQERYPGAQSAGQDHKEGQLIADQFRAQQQQSSAQQNANSQPQAVSYARFFQSLPATVQTLNQLEQQQQPPLLQLPQQQQLPQPQPPPLFKLVTQSTQAPFTFQSTTVTTPSPPSTFFTVNDQTPQRIGVVRIRQDLTTPQPPSLSTLEDQASSTSTYVTTENPISSTALAQSQSTTFSTTQTPFQSRPTLRSALARRTTLQSSTSESLSTFPSRPTLRPFPPLRRRQTTIQQTFFTSPPPTTSLQPVFEESLSTLPPQPVTETSSTLLPATVQPELIQPTFTPLPVFQPQQIQIVSTQPQPLPTEQPLLVTESLPSSTTSQPDQILENQPIHVQRQQFQLQPQSNLQILKSDQNTEEQVTQQPQLQLIHEPQQIQQQLQSIQQQLQLIQQQPQLIQQQPQPVQIIQQQPQLFPQPLQSVQEQSIPQLVQAQPQPVQLIQQQPQLIQPQPQLIQQQPQLIQTQSQLIQPQPQLIQPQLQLIPQQPQQIQLIQQNPQTQQQTESLSQQDQENTEKLQQIEKSEKQDKKESQESNEQEYYSQLLQNNVYSEELYVQPQHLHPVPVGFPYPTSSLHSSSLHSSALHSTPPFLGHSLHSAPSFTSVQYYGKYGPGIFSSWR